MSTPTARRDSASQRKSSIAVLHDAQCLVEESQEQLPRDTCIDTLFGVMVELVRLSSKVKLSVKTLASASALASGPAPPKITEKSVSAKLASAIPALKELLGYESVLQRMTGVLDEVAADTNAKDTKDSTFVDALAIQAYMVLRAFQKLMKLALPLTQALETAISRSARFGYGAVQVAREISANKHGSLMGMSEEVMKVAAICSHATGLVCPGLTMTEEVKLVNGNVITEDITFKNFLSVGGCGQVWDVTCTGKLAKKDLVMKMSIEVS
jgi:hypothetical protein